MSVNTTNPYASNDQLSSLEQDILWEFAKLNDKVKRAANLAQLTAESPNESLLEELRKLERRMGLVLTLFSSSVWGVLNDAQAAEEERARQQAEAQYQEELQQQQQQYQYQGGGDISYDDSRAWTEDSMM
ncbi:DASH complex subunit DAD3 [Kwoniella heveanensis BCC8398]|uniref:DASH complex subunit DAD3 n=1 Tax=Kwoniella heveanensis BCC8398 TaxID=1296120 RepID=A0A1B9GZM2_9TREE|nr:DASH complex subunit DAD3 [Kwoniella heveanensis BCC8398]